MTYRTCRIAPRQRITRYFASSLLAAISIPTVIAAAARPVYAQRDRLVVSPEWVAAHLHDRNLVLLQLGDSTEFRQAHIPGAHPVTLAQVSAGMDRHMDMDHNLTLEMLPPDELRSRLEALGISDDSRVVVYFITDRISPVTRIMYTLRYAGLGDNAVYLDGGLPAWVAENRPVAKGADEPITRGTIHANVEPSLIVDADWVRKHARSPGIALVDARMAGFYDGTMQDDGPRRGHIPGATSLPFEELYDEQNRLRAPAELEARFAKAGVQRGDTVVAYCHIGQRATAVLLAAATLGHPVRLYDGSFQEWGRRADLPVENPADAHGR